MHTTFTHMFRESHFHGKLRKCCSANTSNFFCGTCKTTVSKQNLKVGAIYLFYQRCGFKFFFSFIKLLGSYWERVLSILHLNPTFTPRSTYYKKLPMTKRIFIVRAIRIRHGQWYFVQKRFFFKYWSHAPETMWWYWLYQ